MAPERLALAMVKDGWVLRNKIIWAKTNPMPTSVKDRLSCTWEVVYFFTGDERYHFDLDAVRVPHRSHRPGTSVQRSPRPQWSVPTEWRGPSSGSNSGLDSLKASGLAGHPLGKNPGDVWSIPTAGYRGAHHAVYPTALVERPILATCPEKVCVACGTPWRRDKTTSASATDRALTRIGRLVKVCGCATENSRPGLVLDPFMGSGTTAIVAEQHDRDWIGVELNPQFAALARQRIEDERHQRQANTDTDEPAGRRAA
jgi:DNA modification methylase